MPFFVSIFVVDLSANPSRARFFIRLHRNDDFAHRPAAFDLGLGFALHFSLYIMDYQYP
jgi:hypothetical protein